MYVEFNFLLRIFILRYINISKSRCILVIFRYISNEILRFDHWNNQIKNIQNFFD